jgi:hypothetical protein
MTYIRRQHGKRIRRTGFTFPEIAISAFLIVLLAVFAADIAILIFACSVNDKDCRDVVRAAALQPNVNQAQLFAAASCKNHKTDGFFISPIYLVGGVNYVDFGGNPPVGQTPYVQCTTAVDVTLPAPLVFFGATFTNKMTFKQMYTSPIIKTKYLLP